mmetsp:Transcript_17070/g.15022  ORF Transcript_17070/g.15022 Transcript_17070/m.15022 type:complete len:95 (+) Transcript_17070:562-846(+)
MSYRNKMNLDIIKFLVEHGADKYVKTSRGETVYEFSNNQNNSQEIIDILDKTEQKFLHPKEDYDRIVESEKKPSHSRKKNKSRIIIEETEVNVG